MASKAQYDVAVAAKKTGQLTVYVAKLRDQIEIEKLQFGVPQVATENELQAALAVENS